MAQNKEQLEKLLGFIKMLVDEPGNEEFAANLRKMLGINPSGLNVDNKKIDEIEKYLGLDYRLDSASPIIDYSFVKDDYTKVQLISDNREMLRYRFGVRSHKIDFAEFCRYAMLQVEQLLNYFYNANFSSVEEIANYVNENVEWAKTINVESASSLPLAIKLSAISKSLSKKHRDALDFSREVRNEQSHRGKESTDNDINRFRNRLKELGLPLTRDGEVHWAGIKDNKEQIDKYNTIPKAEYWKYRFLLWYNREPFDEVVCALEEITNQVKETLLNKNNCHGKV